MRYGYALTKAIEKNGFTPIKLPKHAKYELGKTYWCGYWEKSFIVEKVVPICDGYSQEVTVLWEDGNRTTHCTTLDCMKDYELKLA